ncbi:hypothetical protein Tco_1473064, partial [Tanacetum coccineum]
MPLNLMLSTPTYQSQMTVSTSMTFWSANSTEHLVSTVDGRMPLKGLNSVDVRLLSTRSYVLAIITSFDLALGPLEVLSAQESQLFMILTDLN